MLRAQCNSGRATIGANEALISLNIITDQKGLQREYAGNRVIMCVIDSMLNRCLYEFRKM